MPSVITLSSVDGPVESVNRTAKPTCSPSGVPTSSAIRSATLRAAIRRGWVCPISPVVPRPASRASLGSWVVLPEPVAPATTTTWWSRMSRTSSSRRPVTGSSSG